MNTEADNQVAAILGQDEGFMASSRVKEKGTYCESHGVLAKRCPVCGPLQAALDTKPDPTNQLMRDMAQDASGYMKNGILVHHGCPKPSPLVSLLEMIQSEADACQRISTDCPANVAVYYRERAEQFQLWATALSEAIGDEP